MTALVDKYTNAIDALLSVCDLKVVSARKIRKSLQVLLDVDLNEQKEEFDELVLSRFNSLEDRLSNATEGALEYSKSLTEARFNERVKLQTKQRSSKSISIGKAATKSATASQSAKERAQKMKEEGKGMFRKLIASPELCIMLNKVDEGKGITELARTEATRLIWKYIKANNLQNPEKKTEIICDDVMKPIFGERLSSFHIGGALTKHLIKPEDIKLE
ncbi:hypothetical protein NADFUDRAFT_84510 [Nadsonia fulvescens var. elongata DSM 6958]|uniref:Uncharacterized protein n=1 Tax=Nadsonia fulvescens var. elongata DSM 6958 TaxID=857566 RepID=A0A1E3PD87_9ASCO|nr:hypothetical protein NADFUDRAFT_84510 [Nadsonia fulvescens var. elongata DSM 6958]